METNASAKGTNLVRFQDVVQQKAEMMVTVRTEKLIPVFLRDDEFGFMRVLVDDHPDLKVGKYITLNDPEIDSEKRWLVLEINQPIRRSSVHREWNNNI